MENVNGLDWAQAQYDRQEPPYKEHEAVLRCSICQAPIYPGEKYYTDIDGSDICCECIEDFARIAG